MLNDKVVVITGGAGLIGKEFVQAVVENGGIAIIADINEDLGEKVKKDLSKELNTSNIDFVKLDITSKESLNSCLKYLDNKYERIDALVNNAYPRNKNYGKHFFDVEYGDFVENLGLNLGGYFTASQHFAQYFQKQGYGNIINISSIYGVVAPKFEIYEGTKMTVPVEYVAIKSGLIHLTKYMAKYFKGMNIKVNTLTPGGIFDSQPESFLENYKDKCLTKGMLDKSDLKGTLVYLLSDMSKYVNGQNIIVDDGFSLLKILILADQRQRLRSQINLIEQLIKYDPKVQVNIIVACESIESDFTKILNYNNIKIIYLIKQRINLSEKNFESKKSKISLLIKNTTMGQISYSFVLAIKMFRYLKVADKYMTTIKPDILLVNSDRMGVSLEQAFLKMSKKYAIRSIAPYTSVISNGISLRFASFNSYSIKTVLDKILFKILKNQTKNIDGKIIKFYDSSTTIALKLFGLLSLNPWMIGNGLIDYVCLDNLFSLNKYKNDILFPEKFKIVGDIEYDILYHQSILQKKHLNTNYTINNDLPNIIISLPQLAEHFILDWEQHWQEIYFILDELKDINANIFISLHPKMDLNKYVHLEKRYSYVILKEQLRDVIHESDLFIAINSSTVLWSTILGTKTVVLDYFELDSSYFENLSSIQFVKEKKNFKKVVMNTLISKINFIDDFRILSKDDIFDGKTIQRYLELMKEDKISE